LNTKENYEDIISGKTGGTIIICKGVPGTGKTLSAEVYSEVIEKPLYKVQSDQLGIRVDDLEKNLEQVLKRASRWGAILLIDEADVYIQSRDQDLHRNAVVCTFLRTLEYYNGLLFMTTNRSSSIDDAVLSRATAIVEYCVPKNEELTKLWDVLLNNYNIAIKDGELPSIISHFKNITGRSIKNICKLTKKYYGDKQINLDMLKDIEGYVYINKDY
jgi:AAA+ superfamily predicted ATPase